MLQNHETKFTREYVLIQNKIVILYVWLKNQNKLRRLQYAMENFQIFSMCIYRCFKKMSSQNLISISRFTLLFFFEFLEL